MTATLDLAEDWAALLAQDFDDADHCRRGAVAQELARFGRFLAERELGRRGLPPRTVGPRLAELPAPAGAPVCAPVRMEVAAGEACPATDGLVEVQGGAAVGVAPPEGRSGCFAVTAEMFERFSRATGVDSAAFSGTPESVASLLLYVVIFSHLAADRCPSDLETQRLLKKLRFCREQWVAHVGALFDGSPLHHSGVRAETRLGLDPTTRWLLPVQGERVSNRPEV